MIVSESTSWKRPRNTIVAPSWTRCVASIFRLYGSAQLCFSRIDVGDVVEKDVAARRRDSGRVRVTPGNRRTRGERIDEEEVVGGENLADGTHDTVVGRRAAPLVIVDAGRQRHRRNVVAYLGGDSRVIHRRRDPAGARIDARDGFHRQMQHHALTGGLRIVRDL